MAIYRLLSKGKSAGFDVFLSAYKDFCVYEKTIHTRSIGLIVLGSAQWPSIQNHIPEIVSAVNAAKPGSYCFIDIPFRTR